MIVGEEYIDMYRAMISMIYETTTHNLWVDILGKSQFY